MFNKKVRAVEVEIYGEIARENSARTSASAFRINTALSPAGGPSRF